MKVLLDNNKNYYKANMHCHSTNSDGKRTVAQIKEDYKKMGYSIVAFTDHELLIDNSRYNDDEFLTITSCELAVKEFLEKSTLVQLDMKVAHLNVYSLDPHNTDTPCYNSVYDHFKHDCPKELINIPETDYERVYSHEGVTKLIKDITDKGFLVCYNHPVWSLEDARDYLGYKGLWALEVFNTGCWRMGYADYNMSKYDEFLREGENLACVMGDDNHDIEDSFGGYTMINAHELKYDEIMKALKEHNFYVSTGATINSLYIDGDEAHISVPSGKKLMMVTGVRRRDVRDLSKEKNWDDIVFKFSEKDKYIRFELVDEDNKSAGTCAYFV